MGMGMGMGEYFITKKRRVNYIVFIFTGVIDASLLIVLLTLTSQAFRFTSHLTIFLAPLQGSLSCSLVDSLS